MKKSTMTIVAACAAITTGCADESTDYSQTKQPSTSSGPLGSCKLHCRGESLGCTVTTEAQCRPNNTVQVGRPDRPVQVSSCLSDTRWTPARMCKGFSVEGPVDQIITPCGATACEDLSGAEKQAQVDYAQACETAGGDVTECDCGVVACSIDPTK